MWIKDPDAVLDYTFDWEDFLAGDTILSSTWTVPTGLTKDSDSHSLTTTTVWLSGGSAGQYYTITNEITTAQGRTDNRSRRVWVSER